MLEIIGDGESKLRRLRGPAAPSPALANSLRISGSPARITVRWRFGNVADVTVNGAPGHEFSDPARTALTSSLPTPGKARSIGSKGLHPLKSSRPLSQTPFPRQRQLPERASFPELPLHLPARRLYAEHQAPLPQPRRARPPSPHPRQVRTRRFTTAHIAPPARTAAPKSLARPPKPPRIRHLSDSRVIGTC